ncbi:unnamed protein product [Parascedosporium putredinis]|uniref:SMP-30/Gluconolactonase/LRE-like region domain-containing protein n=1 Tax=Parascedosporium putredinis TaxID=1442378 RepID=A0A9P1M8Q8_9PEZI|nr:unnamed protein product [Parascedosporium putredinis]CAI7989372.1 unnamed protein product [Parascedosporium putredinis]
MRVSHLLPAATLAAAQADKAFQLADVGTWFENLAVRPSGSVLATRMDAPEVWHIDPKEGTGSVLVTVPSALSTTGITELTPDVWVFSAANFSFGEPFGLAPGSMAVWKVDLSEGDEGAEPELVARFPDAGFLNGMATWDEKRVLVGDTTSSAIYLLDVETGEFTTALDGPEVAGVNGIRVHDGAVYAVATTNTTLYKIPVTEDAALDGEAEVILQGLGMDDFDVAADGTIYAAVPSRNLVVRISPTARSPRLPEARAPMTSSAPLRSGSDAPRVMRAPSTFRRPATALWPPDATKEAASITAVKVGEAPAEEPAEEEEEPVEEEPVEEEPEEEAPVEEEEPVEEEPEEED